MPRELDDDTVNYRATHNAFRYSVTYLSRNGCIHELHTSKE